MSFPDQLECRAERGPLCSGLCEEGSGADREVPPGKTGHPKGPWGEGPGEGGGGGGVTSVWGAELGRRVRHWER